MLFNVRTCNWYCTWCMILSVINLQLIEIFAAIKAGHQFAIFPISSLSPCTTSITTSQFFVWHFYRGIFFVFIFIHTSEDAWVRMRVCVRLVCSKSGRCLRVLNLQKVGASIENTDNKISDFLFYFWMIELSAKIHMCITGTSKRSNERIV